MAFIPEYILILGFTITVDYFAGILLEKTIGKKTKKIFLIASLVANIGVLVIFKYYNFLNESIDKLLLYFHYSSPLPYLNILLPIGLSFHTFQAMSYTIEVYRENQKAEKKFGIFALYVMFYPQLAAGPIERPQNMLWQFHSNHKYDFENLKSGLMQMAFGLFKKVVIADRLGIFVDSVYAHPQQKSGLTIFIACILYAFQIYCDFSGYTDIGIGAAKTMGFKLMDNFNTPYFSKSIGEFWKRWHISLSTWFRDYLYFPLGGSRVSNFRRYLNLIIVFLISGLWHGANWTFIMWGTIHGVYFIGSIIKNKILKTNGIIIKQTFFVNLIQVVITFSFVTFAWIFFRSPDIATITIIIKKIIHLSFNDSINYVTNGAELLFSFLLIVILLLKEKYFLKIPVKKTSNFFLVFIVLIVSCYLFGIFNNKQFIYFQF